MQTQETATLTPRKPRLPYIAGGIIVVLLLIAAAFVGGRLLSERSRGEGAPSRNITWAKELPQTLADVEGIFDHRQDNSIFVNTGHVTRTLNQPADSPSGPIVDVVVTSQTTIYEDVTARQFNVPPPEDQKIQQVVELGSLDEIAESSLITVWGRKTGDRFIADVLVYVNPAFVHEPE
jgi:hypothetical protein